MFCVQLYLYLAGISAICSRDSRHWKLDNFFHFTHYPSLARALCLEQSSYTSTSTPVPIDFRCTLAVDSWTTLQREKRGGQ